MRKGVEAMGTCASVMPIFKISFKSSTAFSLGVMHEFCEQLFGIFSKIL
jgi:hypothetical protein